jgi:oligopeptide transport system substrate-binding protein
MKRLIAVLCAAVLIGTFLSGCTSDQNGGPTSSEPKVLTFAMTQEPFTLDANYTTDEFSNMVMYYCWAGLYRNVNGQAVPDIATHYDVSDDGLTYTYYLRESYWADGEPLTAHDFEYSVLRLYDPSTAALNMNASSSSIKNAVAYASGEITDPSLVGVKAIDDHTLQFTLESPDPFFHTRVSYWYNISPIRKDYVEQYGADYASSPEKMMYNGPFKITEWEHQASITMEKNEHYWDQESINLDKIQWIVVSDNNTILSMYDLGEVDLIFTATPEMAQAYPDDVVINQGGGLQFLQFTVKDKSKPTANANFRKALSYAIDRNAIIAAVEPQNIAADCMSDPTIYVERDGESVNFNEEYPTAAGVPGSGDKEKAVEFLNAALEEMGYSLASELPTITYVVLDSARHKAYAEAIQNMWETTLGLTNVSIDIYPVPTAISMLIAGDYDIFLSGLTTDDDPAGIIDGWAEGQTYGNSTGYSNSEFTAKIEEMQTLPAMHERWALAQEAGQIILDDAVVLPLWWTNSQGLCKDYVKGAVWSKRNAGLEIIYADVVK